MAIPNQRCPAQPEGMTCETCFAHENKTCPIPGIIEGLEKTIERLRDENAEAIWGDDYTRKNGW